MSTVQIGPYEVKLHPPDSFALRWDLVLETANATTTAAGWRLRIACLGVCWRGKGSPKALLSGIDFIEYAGALVNELEGSGVRPAQLYAAALVAHQVLQASVVSEEDVKHAEDFTQGQTLASTA